MFCSDGRSARWLASNSGDGIFTTLQYTKSISEYSFLGVFNLRLAPLHLCRTIPEPRRYLPKRREPRCKQLRLRSVESACMSRKAGGAFDRLTCPPPLLSFSAHRWTAAL